MVQTQFQKNKKRKEEGMKKYQGGWGTIGLLLTTTVGSVITMACPYIVKIMSIAH